MREFIGNVRSHDGKHPLYTSSFHSQIISLLQITIAVTILQGTKIEVERIFENFTQESTASKDGVPRTHTA